MDAGDRCQTMDGVPRGSMVRTASFVSAQR